ncbi:MAG: GntR family transcriptional regulator [Pseudomonadota bacterium]
MTMHAHSPLPEGGKARRVYLSLRDGISNGSYRTGDLLPSENRLGELYNVSRITVRRALDVLAAEGRIQKRSGAGSMVLGPSSENSKIAASFTSLLPQLVEIDRQTTAKLLSFGYGPASDSVAEAMGLEKGGRVQTAVRVRSSNGQPYSHLTTHVPEQFAVNYGEEDLATQPLFRLLERSGVEVASAKQSVTATLAGPDVAEALAVSTGSALLSLQRVVQDANGRGVEYLSALYRPDLFRLEMDLARVGTGDAGHWQPMIGAREP